FDLTNLRTCEVANLGRETLQRTCTERERGEELGVTVACDHLRRERIRFEAESFARDPLDLRLDLRIRPDRPGQLADAVRLESGCHPAARPIELERPPGKLPPEGRWLGVDPVRAADADRVPVLLRAGDYDRQRAFDPVSDEPSRVLDLQRQRRVDHVRGGQSEVDPASLW